MGWPASLRGLFLLIIKEAKSRGGFFFWGGGLYEN